MSPFFLLILHQYSYIGLFGLLALGGILIPIPEEVTLLTAGYLIGIGVMGWSYSSIVSIVALLAGDSFLFYIAKFGGVYAQKLRTRINKIGLERTWIFSPKQPLRAVFILRFLTGLRFIAPIYAGFEQSKWKWFLAIDVLGIALFVPGMIFLGYFFHASIVSFIAGFEVVRHTVFLIVLAFAGAGMLPVLYREVQRRTKRKKK